VQIEAKQKKVKIRRSPKKKSSESIVKLNLRKKDGTSNHQPRYL